MPKLIEINAFHGRPDTVAATRGHAQGTLIMLAKPPIRLLSLFMVLLLAAAAPERLHADTAAKEVRIGLGRDLARLWCSHCHAVEAEGGEVVQPEVPAFTEIATLPGQTAEKIQAFLIDPHPPMPNLNLTRVETENLAAYILSLGKSKAE